MSPPHSILEGLVSNPIVTDRIAAQILAGTRAATEHGVASGAAMTHIGLGLIPLFPLLGAVAAYVVGRKHRSWSGWIATFASALSFALTLGIVLALGTGVTLQHAIFPWINVGTMHLDFLLRMDRLTAVMGLVVTGIGTLIHLYSIAYMAEDDSSHRFFAYLNLFMFAMLLLVLGGNLAVLFVGWEGVGLCSYLLIGFWHKNIAYAAAGRKAFVVNRIGDAGFLLAMFVLFWTFGTLDIAELAQKISGHTQYAAVANVVALLLFVGATGKSAQIPLFVWLPDAMAGPTPVSALIHAATMVTAGIYMMARLHFIFELAPFANAVVVVVAILTAFIAATTALTQFDIKKVLAYSTVSQLGFMFLAAGAGAYWVAIFHLVTHAFFKACLFLGAGSVIHGCHHEQDMRKMGGLWRFMPITAATYLVAVLAIAGIFPFAGYQSKHAILAALEGMNNPYLLQVAGWIVLLAKGTAFLTAFYMTRSFVMTFLGSYRGAAPHAEDHSVTTHHQGDDSLHGITTTSHGDVATSGSHGHQEHGGNPHESPWPMTVPLLILATLSLFGGLYLVQVLPEYLSVALGNHGAHHEESLMESLEGSWVGGLGVLFAFVCYTSFAAIPRAFATAFRPLTVLFQGKWFFDELYNMTVIRPLEGVARFLWKDIDQTIIDGAVNGTGALVDVTGEVVRHSETGNVRHYALLMFLASIVLVLASLS